MNNDKICRCRLCGKEYEIEHMSEEHYPARSVGNEDIVALNIVDMFDSILSKEFVDDIVDNVNDEESLKKIASNYFDDKMAESLYPNGRTARTLCRECNTFLGKYDEAYLKFFKADGEARKIKGFQKKTKYQMIKAIYAKFLSVPEAHDEKFDFIDFIVDDNKLEYCGEWKLYFVKRNRTTDLMGFKDIGTGKATFDKGTVYELSDDKFIFNLMNFDKHEGYDMTNIFDIVNKNYSVVEGVGRNGGYHAQILMARLFSEMK